MVTLGGTEHFRVNYNKMLKNGQSKHRPYTGHANSTFQKKKTYTHRVDSYWFFRFPGIFTGAHNVAVLLQLPTHSCFQAMLKHCKLGCICVPQRCIVAVRHSQYKKDVLSSDNCK